MSKTILTEGDEGVRLIIREKGRPAAEKLSGRAPVHVVYGGADRFTSDTPRKLGRIALESLKLYAPGFAAFATAFRLRGSEQLPGSGAALKQLEASLKDAPEKVRSKNPAAWFAWTVHQRTLGKLRNEPIEDFRIDFEDGYGFRSDDEEDAHALNAAAELASAYKKKRATAFSGFRIKSFAPETYSRAIRTLDLFLQSLIEHTGGRLPENFVVTLPKVTEAKQVKDLVHRLAKIEKHRDLGKNAIGVELMVETPGSIFDKNGRVALPRLIRSARGRCTSVHFGAYDYTGALGVSATYQDVRHPACAFARSVMQATCAGTGVRVVDSVTTLMPVPVFRDEALTEEQKTANRRSVHDGWVRHFDNVTASMAEGFYQSWDLHPNQLVARYAAVYSFFLSEMGVQAARLKSFVDKATQATMTGNIFDDAASAQGIVNFFRRGLDCGAFSEDEVKRSTGLSSKDLQLGFSQIAATSRKRRKG